MALVSVATPDSLRCIISAIPTKERFNALKGANPRLAAEIERLKVDPRRARALTAESVEEAVGWIDDPEALKAIVAHETRTGIVSAIRYKLARVAPATTPLRSNEANIFERTSRALKRDKVIETLAGMSEVDWDQVFAWYCSLARQERATVLCDLLKIAKDQADLVDTLLTRVFDYDDDLPYGGVGELATACHNVCSAGLNQALSSRSVPADEMFVSFAVTVSCAPRVFPAVPVVPGAVEILQAAGEWEIIALSQSLPPGELAAAMNGMSPAKVFDTLAFCKNAEYVDALAGLLPSWDGNRHNVRRPHGLDKDGISTETRAKLLTYASASYVCGTLANEDAVMPLDEAVALAKRIHEGHTTRLEDLIAQLGQIYSTFEQKFAAPSRVDKIAAANLVAFVDTLFEHCPALLAAMERNYWANKTWVTERIMAKVAHDLSGLPEGWSLFFATSRGYTGTLADLTAAVRAIA